MGSSQDNTTPTALGHEADNLVKHMVNRFLAWQLPENFAPDAGISYKPVYNEHTAHPNKHQPTGTNLFDATQATEMVRYILDGYPTDDWDDSKLVATWPGQFDSKLTKGNDLVASNIKPTLAHTKSAQSATQSDKELDTLLDALCMAAQEDHERDKWQWQSPEVKQAMTKIRHLIAEETNTAYWRGYNTGWQKANRNNGGKRFKSAAIELQQMSDRFNNWGENHDQRTND